MNPCTRLSVALSLSMAATGVAGEIGYRINNGSTQQQTINSPAQGVQIDLGENLVLTDTDIHVFDILDNDPADSVGMLSITGRVAPGVRVRVAVASSTLASVDDAFDPLLSPETGMVDLGGLTFAPPAAFPTDTSLRDSATVSVNVRNLTGDVTAGCIFRVAALQDGLGNGGTISGNITSTQTDFTEVVDNGFDPSFLVAFRPAIAHVVADHSITGNIEAQAVASGSAFRWNPDQPGTTRATWSSIGKVLINGTADTDVLTGDVTARYGQIDEVVASRIGTETNPVTVRAGVRVGQVVSHSTLPAYLSLFSGERGKDDAATSNALKQLSTLSGVPETPSSLQLLDVSGDLIGDIQLFDVYGDPASASSAYTHEDDYQGIFVDGAVFGNITIDYDYENADMIARSFRGPISVGQLLKGAVVAVGRDVPADSHDGTMHSIVVGFGGDRSAEDPFFAGPNPGEDGGFQGQWKTILLAPMDGPGVREVWFGPAPRPIPDGRERSADSVIRAYTSIGSVTITNMSNDLLRADVTDTPPYLRPRIESPSIGSVSIDEFKHGSIWSGTLIEFPAQPYDNIEDNYASIGTLAINCVGPAADIWVRDTQLIDIASNLAGEIHMRSLDASQTVRIGDRLTDVASLQSEQISRCGVQASSTNYFGLVFGYNEQVALRFNHEPTPRSSWDTMIEGTDIGYPLSPSFEHPDPPFAVETNTLPFDGVNRGVASYGRILIREPDGLRGQIIIDANNAGQQRAGAHWLGDVEIGTGQSSVTGDPNIPATPEVISTDDIRATAIGTGTGEGPLYTALPSSFGGGAVGLVPFTVHGPACDPPHRSAPIILDSEFNGYIAGVTPAIYVEFYGPVTPINPSNPPVAVEYVVGSRRIDMTRFFAFTMNPAERGNRAARTIKITRSTDPTYSSDLLSGEYRVVARLTDPLYTSPPPYNLYCDLGPGLSPVIVDRRFEYVFTLGADCDRDGSADADEIAADPDLDDEPANGVLDECEATPGDCAPCAADFDDNGGVDGADLAAFFLAFEGGTECADVDQNGGIDGGDLAFFFSVFEAGGC